MIGTLFAQDARASWKNILGSIGIALLVAAVSFTIAALRVPVLEPLLFGLGVIVVALITPFVLGLLVEHYWRTMYGREGYFTMALPVRGGALFSAKVLYGIAAALFALAVTAAGLVGATVSASLSQRRAPFAVLEELARAIDAPMLWFLAGAIAVQIVFTVVTGAAIISIGSEGRFNHLGFGAPVLGYVGLYLAMQVLGLAAMLFIPFGLSILGPDSGSIVWEGMLGEFITAVSDPSGETQPSVIGLGIVPLSIVVAAVFWWWGARSVSRRTSLR